MKLKFKNHLIIALFVLLVVASGLSIMLMAKTADAATAEYADDVKAWCKNSFDVTEQKVRVFDKEDDCLDFSDRDTNGEDKNHGNGRENGGKNLLNVGCRNYKKSGFNYGSTNIPYWINMSMMNDALDEANRQIVINKIRVQTQLWNQVYMHDGTGKLVNFYEVASENKPTYIDGKRVIEIVPHDFCDDEKTKGNFIRKDYILQLGCDFQYKYSILNEQTVAHELGHVLGLGDLDGEDSSEHKVLMGYALSISSENLSHIMSYQDIQGVAVVNGLHKCSDANFMRYVKTENGYYQHICFYCDRVFGDDKIITGSKEIAEVCDDKSHDYQPMVSNAEVRWEKCTKCYRVNRVELYAPKKDDNEEEKTPPKINFCHFGDNTKYFSVEEAWPGKVLPQLDNYAPTKKGFVFDGYCDASGKKYYKMEHVEDEQSSIFRSYSYYACVEKVAPVSASQIWDHRNGTLLYAVWKPLECNYEYQIVCDGNLSGAESTYLKYGMNSITPASIDGYEFKYFEYGGKQYSSVPAQINIELYCNHKIKKEINEEGKVISEIVDAQIKPKDGIIVAYYEKTCLADGSLITLADGSQTAVENLTGDEMLLVWNLYTGAYDVAPILFIDSDPAQLYKVINLSFSDGTVVKVISEHGFWDYDLNKYVYLDADAENYIGHWFNKGNGRVQLVGVEIKDEYTSAWSPVTYGHLCYFVNGMLSMPGGIGGLFNIFEVDPTTMKYDEALMKADIEEYGLFTYEEFTEYFYLPEEAFEAFNGQYMKVAIGKGLISMEQLASLYNRYSDFLA